jgi:hypothetical protein
MFNLFITILSLAVFLFAWWRMGEDGPVGKF